MTAVRETDEPSRSIWTNTLGTITRKDITKRGKAIAVAELSRIMPQFERLLAVNPIDAAIMSTGRDNFRSFQNLKNATHIESKTGIKPGDPGYKLVQATLIHVSVTSPKQYGPDDVHLYLEANHDDIAYIAEQLDDTIRLIPELYKHKDASRGFIETLRNISPALVEGAL
jgi:hypothetical protein